jgi:hypothetical protein
MFRFRETPPNKLAWYRQKRDWMMRKMIKKLAYSGRALAKGRRGEAA